MGNEPIKLEVASDFVERLKRLEEVINKLLQALEQGKDPTGVGGGKSL